MFSIKHLLKGTAIYGIGQITNRLLTFVMLPVYTYYLSPDEFGIYAILTIILWLSASIFSLGLNHSASLVFFESRNEDHRSATIWGIFILLTGSVFCYWCLAYYLSAWTSSCLFKAEISRYHMLLIVAASGFWILTQPGAITLQYREKPFLYIIASFLTSLLTVGLNLFFLVGLQRGLQGLLESILLANCGSFLFFFIIILCFNTFKIDWPKMQKLLLLGAPYIFGATALLLVQYVDRYLLEFFKSFEEVGVYSVGYSLGMVVMLFVGAFSIAWIPFFNSFMNNQEECRKIFPKIFFYYLITMGYICLGVVLFAAPIVSIILSPAYHAAAGIMAITGIAQFFYGCYINFLPGIYFFKRTGLLNVMLCAVLVINFVLNILLIPDYGIYGAAWSTLLSMVFLSVATYMLSKRFFKLSYDWRRIIQYSLIWSVFALVGLTLDFNHMLERVSALSGIMIVFFVVTLWRLTSLEKMAIKKFIESYKSLLLN